jgi:uncharacterized membrane protein YqiK
VGEKLKNASKAIYREVYQQNYAALSAQIAERPDLMQQIQAVAPKTAKTLENLALAKVTTIDWLAPAYQAEWANLRQSQHELNRWLVQFYDSAKSKTHEKEHGLAYRQLYDLAAKILKNPKAQ